MENRLSFANVGHDRFAIHQGDCLEVMRGMADASVDSIVTDPPYELGFMGKSWDASGVAFNVDVWREALRVLKPGGHLLAFGGSRTYHRMACAIEDAGFEIRDQIMWLYGSGFPKSLDVSKAIDKVAGAEREVLGVAGKSGSVRNCMAGDFAGGEYMATAPATDAARQWQGWGTALKPAHEPIVVARKPLVGTVAENVLAHGTGALNIDGCRVGADGGTKWVPQGDKGDEGQFGGGIKDGGIDRVPGLGRWPANVIHDGSDEVVAAFPDAPGQQRAVGPEHGEKPSVNCYGDMGARPHTPPRGDTGSAARFFYCAKASKKDRGEGNNHPTVKPTALMRYLCRLVTPPGGLVLDPFMGSGSTGKAAMLEGFRFVGIELSEEYIEIARARIASAAR